MSIFSPVGSGFDYRPHLQRSIDCGIRLAAESYPPIIPPGYSMQTQASIDACVLRFEQQSSRRFDLDDSIDGSVRLDEFDCSIVRSVVIHQETVKHRHRFEGLCSFQSGLLEADHEVA